MEFDHKNVRRRVVEEDRLSRLPDELIHKILSSVDMKIVVQTCSLSSRWKLIWKSLPCLNFSCANFRAFSKYVKFVTDVVSHRNHQIEVSSLKLNYRGTVNQGFMRNIANYAFSHNVEELTVITRHKIQHISYPPCLFSSQSLKHLTLTCNHMQLCDPYINKTPLDFPALTTLNLSYIRLWGDVFSKCVNLKNLTLKHFVVEGPKEVFDIITPHLSNLILTHGHCSKTINLMAPQLENLTIISCSINYLNAPTGLSSLCYKSRLCSYGLLKFSNDGFHSLNKVSICVSIDEPNKEEDACKTINILHKLHSAKYLTLDADTIECISSFPPDLLSQHSSPFSNLICLTIDTPMRNDAYKVNMSVAARNLLLGNSPSATLMMKLSNQGSK